VGKQRAVIAKTYLCTALVNAVIFVLAIVPGQEQTGASWRCWSPTLTRHEYFRTIYFSPVVTSMAVIAIVWKFLYNPEEGLINRFLTTVSFGHITPPGWLVDSDTSLLAIIILSAWQAAGFQMVIFLAGQGIPDVLYEAAQMDGANTWQLFRFVTWPNSVTPYLSSSARLSCFRLFTQIDVHQRRPKTQP
jgi:ABC-type sugar transport system permease subunit